MKKISFNLLAPAIIGIAIWFVIVGYTNWQTALLIFITMLEVKITFRRGR